MDERELLSAILKGQEKLVAEVQGLRKDVNQIKEDIAEIKQELSEIKTKIEELDDNFDLLAGRIFDTRLRVKQIEKKSRESN